jgi:hypothetical protein
LFVVAVLSMSDEYEPGWPARPVNQHHIPDDPSNRHEAVARAVEGCFYQERGKHRIRVVNWFIRRQKRIALEDRFWLCLTEVADEFSRRPGAFAVEDNERTVKLEALRAWILARKFSIVLNMHPHVPPSELGRFRFDRDSAAIPELINPHLGDLWIKRQDCAAWAKAHGFELPHRLQPTASPAPSVALPDVPQTDTTTARHHFNALRGMLDGRNSTFSDDIDRAAARDKAALDKAIAEQLQIDLTPEREAALSDLTTGEGDVKTLIEVLRPVRYLLDALPHTPRVLAVRELTASPPNLSGCDDDPYWTPGQMILWAITGDRWAVDQASNGSRPGWFSAQERARNVIDALALPRQAISDAANKLRRLCLSGAVEAVDGRKRQSIPTMDWFDLGIVLTADNVLIVRRQGQPETDPGESILFPRDAAAVLRAFPAGTIETDSSTAEQKEAAQPNASTAPPAKANAPRKNVKDDTYASYQWQTRARTSAFSSGDEDEAWAKAGGYSVESVRAARKRFKAELSEPERKEFEKPGPRRRKSD